MSTDGARQAGLPGERGPLPGDPRSVAPTWICGLDASLATRPPRVAMLDRAEQTSLCAHILLPHLPERTPRPSGPRPGPVASARHAPSIKLAERRCFFGSFFKSPPPHKHALFCALPSEDPSPFHLPPDVFLPALFWDVFSFITMTTDISWWIFSPCDECRKLFLLTFFFSFSSGGSQKPPL